MNNFIDRRRHTSPDIPIPENEINSTMRHIRAHKIASINTQKTLFEGSGPIKEEYILCPYCGSIDPHPKHNMDLLKEYQCAKCNKTFYKRIDGQKLTSEDFELIKSHK